MTMMKRFVSTNCMTLYAGSQIAIPQEGGYQGRGNGGLEQRCAERIVNVNVQYIDGFRA